MKILKVEKKGFLDSRRIIREDYAATRKQFKDEFAILLPNLKDTPFANSSDVRVLLNDITIKVTTDDGVRYYHFKKGFITDLASVPKILRSLVDNDDEVMLLAALVHDANFRWHFLSSFKRANDMFRQMIAIEDDSWWLAFKAWVGVNTSAGKKAYYGKKELDKKFQRVSYSWRDK